MPREKHTKGRSIMADTDATHPTKYKTWREKQQPSFSNSGHSNHGHGLNEHRDSVARRLSNWRNMQLARQALSVPASPPWSWYSCGAGRFWSLLAEQPNRVIFAADSTADILEMVARVKFFGTSL